MKTTYIKFRFKGKAGATAGLVVTASKYNSASFGELSRMFPVSEFPKMYRLESSPMYPTKEQAFNHEFN